MHLICCPILAQAELRVMETEINYTRLNLFSRPCIITAGELEKKPKELASEVTHHERARTLFLLALSAVLPLMCCLFRPADVADGLGLTAEGV